MEFSETPIPGAVVIDVVPREDERGLFARTFDAAAFAAHGLAAPTCQSSTSYNRRAGTLRGLHYQADPHGEDKLVRCTQGAIFDVIVDLRPGSASYRRWIGVELTAANRRALFVPPGVAHGFQTLTDDAEVLYQMSVAYVAEAARGVRWDDPAFAIDWPAPPGRRTLSERDAAYPVLEP